MRFRAAGTVAIACITAAGAWTACTAYDDKEPDADAGSEAGITSSSGANEAGPTTSGGTSSSGGTPDAACCDCDGDGWPKKSCVDASVPPDAAAPKFDCDDSDPATNPDQGYSARPITGAQTGDWNCDGVVSKEPSKAPAFPSPCVFFPASSDNCTKVGNDFYLNEVPCGTSVKLGACEKQGSKCVAVEGTSSVIQKCR